MPVLSWAHSQYWQFDDGVGPPPQLARPGYPVWQSGVIAGSLFGAFQFVYERAAWWVTWIRRLWGWSAKDRAWMDARVDRLLRLSIDPDRVRVVPKPALDQTKAELRKQAADAAAAQARISVLEQQWRQAADALAQLQQAQAAEDAAKAQAPPEHRHILDRVLLLLEHPAYPIAREVVRDTALTLGFNKPSAWATLGHLLKARYGWAENSWRHLNAMHLLDERHPGLTNPERNLLIELAYAGYAARPRD